MESNSIQQIGVRSIQTHECIRISTTSFPQIIQELLQSPQPFLQGCLGELRAIDNLTLWTPIDAPVCGEVEAMGTDTNRIPT